MNLGSNFILAGFSNKGCERQRFYHSYRLEERWIRVEAAAEVDYSTLAPSSDSRPTQCLELTRRSQAINATSWREPHTVSSNRVFVEAGRTPEQLSRDFEPSAQTIRDWAHRADLEEGRRTDGLTTDEREELKRLRRENRQLKLEREARDRPEEAHMA